MSPIFPNVTPSEDSADTYYVHVDPNQDNMATEIKLLSFKRPQMRAVYCSWMGFFTAFFIWFAMADSAVRYFPPPDAATATNSPPPPHPSKRQ